jgi:hypothetical protein
MSRNHYTWTLHMPQQAMLVNTYACCHTARCLVLAAAAESSSWLQVSHTLTADHTIRPAAQHSNQSFTKLTACWATVYLTSTDKVQQCQQCRVVRLQA